MGAEGLKKDQHPSDVPITQRQRSVAAEWIDRLLLATCDVKPGASLEEAATTIIGAVSDVIPEAGVGVCIPAGESGQIVVRRSPRVSHSQAPDPARLFPEYAWERVAVVQYDEGSTLHIASDDEERFVGDGPYQGLIERLSVALGAAIRQSRAFDRSRAKDQEVRGLQAQVIQSEKLASLGQIAAGIVHELNNPLTSIVAYSDYLRKKGERTGADPTDVERLLRINEAAERILRFSRDLIAYSRPSAEVPAPVAIHDIIDRALVFCEHVLEQTNVQVERNFGQVRAVRGVPGQLTQVFVNLFTNACHAMRGAGGSLRISTGTDGAGAVTITITDEGHGIGAENLPRIFEPFFTTKTDGSGTGLGLSIVRNIVLSHGGTIRADGHTPRGTVFYVELPAAASPGEP